MTRRKHAPSRLERLSDWTLSALYGIRNPKKARTRVARSEGAKRGWETRRARREFTKPLQSGDEQAWLDARDAEPKAATE